MIERNLYISASIYRDTLKTNKKQYAGMQVFVLHSSFGFAASHRSP
jgi:hypothetical protein